MIIGILIFIICFIALIGYYYKIDMGGGNE